MNISQLGWCDFWAEFRNQSVARVSSVQKNIYRAIDSEGEILCYLSGKFTYGVSEKSELPAVGDWIELSPFFMNESGDRSALVHKILPRKSKISRVEPGSGATEEQVLAANIDYAFITCSINQDLSINRIQRYIFLAESGGVKPIVLLSKCDLDLEYKNISQTIQKVIKDTPVLPISVEQNLGLEKLNSYLNTGSTIVVIGSSGVGKSTLVNHLMRKNIQEVSNIRESDGKGRHTTTSRELFILPNSTLLIDTPGLREVHVFGNVESIDKTFSHIQNISSQCKFSNCSHSNEPGCKIKEAIEVGDILSSEYENYLKMKKEVAYANRKMSKKAASNSKKQWKKINIDMKKRRKFENENF